MPTRLLRDSILDSESVNLLSPEAELFYRRLMSVVDDYGRFDARAKLLRSRVFPLKIESITEEAINLWLAECEKAGLILLYEVNSKPYLQFHKLGTPRAKVSKYPSPYPSGALEQTESGEFRVAWETHENICVRKRADVPYSGPHADADASAVLSAIVETDDAGERENPSEPIPPDWDQLEPQPSPDRKSAKRIPPDSNPSPESKPADLNRLARQPLDARTADAIPPQDRKSPSKTRKVPDSVHGIFIEIFTSAWRGRYGEAYPFNGEKDGKAMKWFREQCQDDSAKFHAVIERYLADPDDFILKNRHSIGLLRSQFQKWLVGPVKPPPIGIDDSKTKLVLEAICNAQAAPMRINSVSQSSGDDHDSC